MLAGAGWRWLACSSASEGRFTLDEPPDRNRHSLPLLALAYRCPWAWASLVLKDLVFPRTRVLLARTHDRTHAAADL